MKRLWFSLLFFSQSFMQTTVAVMEFESEGLENISSTALSSIVRREVKDNDDLILLDRNMMKQVMQEQGFQQSGCTSSECAVEVGQLLGVQKMITGSISALGQLFIVEIFILDVESGQIEKSQMFEHVGRIEELINPLRDNTRKLLSDKSSNISTDTYLYIESKPAGGMVFVNRKNIGSAPIKYQVEPGDYEVKIKSQGYQDWMQMVTLSLGDNKVLSGELVKFEISKNNSSGGGSIGEWEFWGVSQQDYIRLKQLNITKLEWSETFQPNNLTVEIIDTYKNLYFPKNLWVKIFITDLPTNIASQYYQWSLPIGNWASLYNSEFGKIPINIASQYYQWSIPYNSWSNLYNSEFSKIPIDIASQYYQWSFPFDNWVDTYKSGLSAEQIASLVNIYEENIIGLIGYFKKIKLLGYDNVQTMPPEITYLKWNLNFNELIFSKVEQNNIKVHELLEKVSSIENGNDIFFTNDFTKLNYETQKIVYDYFDVKNNFIEITKKINKYKKTMIRNWVKSPKGYIYAKPLSNNLSIGFILLLFANQVPLKDVSGIVSAYYDFIFDNSLDK